MLVDLHRYCPFILVRNPLDTLNAASWLVVPGIVGEHSSSVQR